MTSNEANLIAEKYMSTLDMKGYTAIPVDTRKSPDFPDEWSVVYDVFSPNGNLIDGPMVVIVNEITKSAHLMVSL